MSAELLDKSLRRNSFLAGLVDQWGAEAVSQASFAGLGYPADFVSTHVEATKILAALQSRKES